MISWGLPENLRLEVLTSTWNFWNMQKRIVSAVRRQLRIKIVVAVIRQLNWAQIKNNLAAQQRLSAGDTNA
jgi:sugar-specific transcriptional regulator TrmB